MAEYKKEGKLKALIVTGCLAQRYQQEIIDEIPEVDAVLGTTSYDHIVEAVEEALAGNGHVVLEDVDALPDVKEKRLVTTGGHSQNFVVITAVFRWRSCWQKRKTWLIRE